MAQPSVSAGRPSNEAELRARRWRFFRVAFGLTCLAISGDVLTTYLGFRRIGSRFEQNGVALYIIEHVGWFGLVVLLALVCYVCLRSFRLVYWKLGAGWSRWLNPLVAVVCAFRWVVVISNAIWLLQR